MRRSASDEWPTADFVATIAERPLCMGDNDLCRAVPCPVALTAENGLSEPQKRITNPPNYPDQLFYCYFTSQSPIAEESLVGGQ